MSKCKVTANRYHDISVGHRVVGHEGKCRHLHGHNYRIHFFCEAAKLDELGRVIDFSVIKEKLCMWLETNWDHKFLAWEKDTLICSLDSLMFQNSDNPTANIKDEDNKFFNESIVWVDFNPTAENLAEYLLNIIGPRQLAGTGVTLTKVIIEETRKCSVTCEK